MHTDTATNFVLCFDHADDPSHLDTLAAVLDTDTQMHWRGTDVADAYRLLLEHWQADDKIFVFGARHGAYRAMTLCRLLDTVGVLRDVDVLIDYVLSAWTVPRTRRTRADWTRLAALGSALRDGQPSVPVHYLGLWDMAKMAGRHSLSTLRNIEAGRHAVGLDEYRHAYGVNSTGVDEVWFRGSRAEVSGAAGSPSGLARIAGEWVFDGARRAGLQLRADTDWPAPTVRDATDVGRALGMTSLAGARLPSRPVPDGSRVHASVELHLRAHAEYWTRLPRHLVWIDPGWLDRPERLLSEPHEPARTTELERAS